MKRVAVYCGSSHGVRPTYSLAAQAMGRALAKRGLGLVYGGGRVGLMGVLADAALDAGGTVHGVIPEALDGAELAHYGLTELSVVKSMHERKARMADEAAAFVAMPGGFGTLDELFEVLTWAQLGFHRKPVGLLDVDGFFAPLLAMADAMVGEGFVRAEHRAMIRVAPDPEGLLDALALSLPPVPVKWGGAR
jgi:uncharacterized protein (TIGR00730 family)